MSEDLEADQCVARELLLRTQQHFAAYGGELRVARSAGVGQQRLSRLYPYDFADLAAGVLVALRDPARGAAVQTVFNSRGWRHPAELYKSPAFELLQRQEEAWAAGGFDALLAALLPEYARAYPKQSLAVTKDNLEVLLWDVFDSISYLQHLAHMLPASRTLFLARVVNMTGALGVRLPPELLALGEVSPPAAAR